MATGTRSVFKVVQEESVLDFCSTNFCFVLNLVKWLQTVLGMSSPRFTGQDTLSEQRNPKM